MKRASERAGAGGLPGFNPHPPLLAGETGWSMAWGLPPHCFNPHPPLLAGETLQRAIGQHGSAGVSIHTRHYWRVKQLQRADWPRHCRFNPHPPLLAGETAPAAPARAGWQFQSTPAITGG